MRWDLWEARLSKKEPDPLTFPPLNDPLRHQPQKCQQDETQDGGGQDVEALIFHPRHRAWAVVECSEEGRRGREKGEVRKGGG